MFKPQGAKDVVRKSTSDSKKLKAIADALGVDSGSVASAKVELTMKGGQGGSASKGGTKSAGKGGMKSGAKGGSKGR